MLLPEIIGSGHRKEPVVEAMWQEPAATTSWVVPVQDIIILWYTAAVFRGMTIIPILHLGSRFI